jgi:hypothetical protein
VDDPIDPNPYRSPESNAPARPDQRSEEPLAVDRETRNELRDALIAYMRGETGSFAFGNKIDPVAYAHKPPDRVTVGVARFLWLTYSDTVDHSISVTAETWAALRRIVAFLQTDLELEGRPEDEAWPFRDEEQWQRHEHLVSHIDLPPYDPAIHGRPIGSLWDRIPTGIGLAIIAGGVLLLLVVGGLLSRFK